MHVKKRTLKIGAEEKKMRLIDADKLKQSVTSEMLKAELNSHVYLTLECVVADIENQPTAYDVNKVIDQLKENSFIPGDWKGVSDKKVIMTEKGSEIVKAGRVNE